MQPSSRRSNGKRSIRSIILALETLALAATGLLFFLTVASVQRFTTRSFIERRTSELTAIDQVVNERLLQLGSSLEVFASDPDPLTVPLLGAISDLYRLDATGTVLEIYKGAGDSAVFPGYPFGGPLGGPFAEFVLGQSFSTPRVSPIFHAPEDWSPSFYFIVKSANGLFLARLPLENLRDELHRLVRYDGTIALLVTSEGIPLTQVGGVYSGILLRQRSGDLLVFEGQEFIVSRAPAGNHAFDIVLLNPTNQLSSLKSYLTRLFVLGFLALVILFASRMLLLNSTLLSPLRRFVYALEGWGPENPLPTLPRIARSFRELPSLERIFSEKAQELLDFQTSLETQVAERTDQLAEAMDQLVLGEKLAVLGRMSAGVAHELNTPLAAIVSTSSNLKDSYQNLMGGMNTLLEAQDPESRELFRDLIHMASDQQASRREKLAFYDRLEEFGMAAEEAEIAADELRDMGVPLLDTSLARRIAQVKGGLAAVQAAYRFSLIGRTADLVRNAAERAALTVRAMKLWVYDEHQERRRLSIREELETILTLYYNQTKRNVRILRKFSDEGWVDASPEHLNGVWVNLMNNALQAMQECGGTLTLRIALRDDGFVEVSFEDTGCGIPEDIKDRIFTPFFTTKPKGAGTGIGLDLSKRIVESYGGSISFESGGGKTLFTVRLPATREQG